LNLDITNPLEDDFITNLQESWKRPYVIGMMFSGDAKTENPDRWITNFKNRNYTILSVILNASLQTLIQRVNERCHHHKSLLAKQESKRYPSILRGGLQRM
jgi:hypothetical protein